MLILVVLTFGLFVVLFTREVIAPASGASCDKRWRIYAFGLNAAAISVAIAGGLLFPAWIERHALLVLPDALTPVGKGLMVFLTASFVAYWWHRLTHASDTLWRAVHQLHHSPSRIEVLTAFYVHPLDSFTATALNALIAYGLFGVGALEASIALGLVTLFNLVAHADQKSPYWLGFILQRPEMHRLHHERHAHRSNYGLPVWDLLFSTWRNPRAGEVECGFEPDKEYRITDMLLMKDVDG